MTEVKSAVAWMAERGLELADVVRESLLEERVINAIIQGRYTPSPQQRKQLAAALRVEPEQISWGHVAPVEHMYGHGPQFGRSP